MSISFLVPFRDDGGVRAALKDWTIARWRWRMPGCEFVVATDDGGSPFCKTMAVNKAAKRAKGDILAILDADIIVDPREVRRAENLIRGGHAPWVLPCRWVQRLSKEYTERLLELPPTCQLPQRGKGDVTRTTSVIGFLHVFPRAAWERVGGMDERFRGWGWEDNAWMWMLDLLWGRHVTLDGTVYHMDHQRKYRGGKPVWEGQTARNAGIGVRYRNARRNKALMQGLSDEIKKLRSV